ncbi:MAG TPA: DUF4336 domain-containing protein, partial [Stenomitos sp.]
MTPSEVGSASLRSPDYAWPLWPVVPLYPYGRRRTLRTEIVPGTIWTFDQIQGVFYVVTPIRMTVVKLEAGGLLVYAPVAPTAECIRLVRELETVHGAVRFIILPTASGLEHKVFVGPFARRFPDAQIFVTPNQWSFPFNLPLSWLGLPSGRTHCLPTDSRDTPFGDEFDYDLLGPIGLGLGTFEEVAFFHRRSQTLLLTDTLVAIPPEPPPIVQLEPYPLLFHARESACDVVVDTPSTRRKGWERIVLFGFYFRPGVLDVADWGATLREAAKASDRSRQAYFGLYPFRWQTQWQASFAALYNEGKPFVAPVLQTLILNRAPQATLDWALRVANWNFHRIIPCHFAAPLSVSPYQFLQAFEFLQGAAQLPARSQAPSALPEADLAL